MSNESKLQHAEISWSGDTPRSELFDDIYFSSQSGYEESEYVFLKQNGLPENWSNNSQYVIAETGFGTGLNFLLTARHWQKNKNKQSHLIFYSTEKYPLTLTDLITAQLRWPQFTDLTEYLHRNYPGNIPGFHRIEFPHLNITLILMIGDAQEMIQEMNCSVDCWYLDGFSPAKNPDMWSLPLMQTMAAKSRQGTRFATFTAAGFVRRNLQAAGFNVEKKPGFGRKREMLCGSFQASKPKRNCYAPWYVVKSDDDYDRENSVVIIGAGLAGLSTAYLLAKRGIKSRIFEAQSDIASGASGNAAGIVLPRFTLDMNTQSQFYLSGFLESIAWYDHLKSLLPDLQWINSGVLQMEDESRIAKIKMLRLPIELLQIMKVPPGSSSFGDPLDEDVIFYPTGGYLNPKQLCESLYTLENTNIKVNVNATVESLQYENEHWLLKDNDGLELARSRHVVIANGYAAEQLLKTSNLKINKNRGQVTYLSGDEVLNDLNMPLCRQGYIIPKLNKIQCLGATYSDDNSSLELSVADHLENLSAFEGVLVIEKQLDVARLSGRASFRSTTQDHLPLVGPMFDEMAYKEKYADIHHGKSHKECDSASYLPGLYLNIGHGSRGLVSCYPSAQYLADLISGRPLSLPQKVVELLHPARFLIRQLKKSPATH